ncbi:MAG: DUF1775 domain-containing protein [Aquabacterium sp.]|nr:MAG: DUF1775 domain-containing protein [Aquabacterium sp.]
MTFHSLSKLHLLLPAAVAVLSAQARAHVTLPPEGAPAGSFYTAAFHVGHACKGSSATTGIVVRLPEGFGFIDAEARPGWTVTTRPGEVSWTAGSAATALPMGEKTRFVLSGRLPDKPGTLWFKVLQTCDQGSVDWAEIPEGTGAKPVYPAARLEVLPAGTAPASEAAVPGHQH